MTQNDTEQVDATRPGVGRAALSDTPELDTTSKHPLADHRSKSFPRSDKPKDHGKEPSRLTHLEVSPDRCNSIKSAPGHSGTRSDSSVTPGLLHQTHATTPDANASQPSRRDSLPSDQHSDNRQIQGDALRMHGGSNSSAKVYQAEQATDNSADTQYSVEATNALLAGEAVVPLPAPTAADAVISAVVHPEQGLPYDGDQQPAAAPASDTSYTAYADETAEATALSSLNTLPDSNANASQQQASQLAQSSSSHSKHSSTIVVLLMAGISAAGGLWLWLKQRNSSSVPAIAAEDDEFTRALREMEAEEKVFEKQAAVEDDTGAELSAEEAAHAMQQADAVRKEKMIAAALADGDVELARIDALDSADIENLDPDELAALEAELAELEGIEGDE